MGPRFQVLFHSPPGVLFTFPSRYFFTIGSHHVFSLGRWSSQIQAGFLVPHPTQVPRSLLHATFRVRDFHPLWLPFPVVFLYVGFKAGDHALPPARSYNPYGATQQGLHTAGLGSSQFARRYYGNLALDVFSSRYLDGSVPWVSLRATILFTAR